MIVCPKCSKENQDHYKFCLGCGHELPRESAGGRQFRSPTPQANPIADVGRAPVAPSPITGPAPFVPPPAAAPAPAPPPAAAPVMAPMAAPSPSPPPSVRPMPSACPQCASPNPRGNRFCITCGFDMATVTAVPPAPAAVQPPPPAPVIAPVVEAPTPALAEAPAVAARPERARLVLIRPDGTEGGHHSLLEGENGVGRDASAVFTGDPFLSPRHATFVVSPGSVTVRDEGSLNGIYLRIERQQPVELRDGDVFRIGQEILRFEAFHPAAKQPDGTERIGADADGLVGKIVLVTGRDSYTSAFPVPVTGLYLGRERGDILFPEDGYVSGLHCQLALGNSKLTLTDVGSSNGSYVRLNGPRTVRNGDFVLLGQQLFRIHVL